MSEEEPHPVLTLEVPPQKRAVWETFMEEYYLLTGQRKISIRNYRVAGCLLIAASIMNDIPYSSWFPIIFFGLGLALIILSTLPLHAWKWARQYASYLSKGSYEKRYCFGHDALTVTFHDLLSERIPYPRLSGYVRLPSGILIKYGKARIIAVLPWEILTEETTSQLKDILEFHSIQRETLQI